MDITGWRFEQIGKDSLAGVICWLPHHVRMFSGYTPRLGIGLALATADGRVRLAVPEDEVDLARQAGVQVVEGITLASLHQRVPVADALTDALRRLAAGVARGARVGYEDAPQMTPNVYVSTLQLGGAAHQVLSSGLAGMELVPSSDLLRR